MLSCIDTFEQDLFLGVLYLRLILLALVNRGASWID